MIIINLTDRIYKGLHNGMDRVAYNLLSAKFSHNKASQRYVNSYAIDDLKSKMANIDCIVPIKPRDSGSSIVADMAQAIARHYKIPFVDALKIGNTSTKANANIVGKRCLLVDDVIYTGKTLEKATTALIKTGAKNIKTYAIAKSKSYK